MDSYESYRRLVEADSAGATTPDVTGDPHRYVPEVVAAWWGRYRRQQSVIDSIDDAEVKRSVTMRGINHDMTQTELPDWTDDEWRVFETMADNQRDLPKVTGLHGYGPSIRALWSEGQRGGASHASAWLHIVAWARRPPSPDDFAPEVFAQPPAKREPAPARVFKASPDLRPEQLLPRYLAGEREQVWEDIMSLGSRVREPSLLPLVSAVVTETMRRSRRNVERLVASLRGIGYRFWDGLDVMDTSPTLKMALGNRVIEIPNLGRRLRRKEPRGPDYVWQPVDVADLAGALPLSVEAWFREVGNVDFSGRHPELCQFDNDPEFRGVYADPLIFFLEPGLIEETQSGDYLAVSMDAECKAGQASAAQMDGFYSVRVPDVAADGILYGVPGQRTFVEYLRDSFAWAGFPGWRDADDPPLDLIKRLTQDLEPI